MTENVVKYGSGVDLLVHEVCAAPPEITNAHAKAVMAHHISPQEAGTVFARAQPKMAAFTLIVLISRPSVPPPSIDDVISSIHYEHDESMEIGRAAAYRHQRARQLSNLLGLKTGIFAGGRAGMNSCDGRAPASERSQPAKRKFAATRQILLAKVAPTLAASGRPA
jgi:hypothetical protein